MFGHCVASINDDGTKHLLVGGINMPTTTETYIFDWNDQTLGWTPVGNLPVAVNYPSCVRATIENGSKDVVVVAGGSTTTNGASDAVQIYEISSEIW